MATSLQGYRDAQCGWLVPPPSHPAAPLGLLLLLLAPKRRTLEVWMPREGRRLAAVAVNFPCLLLPVAHPCGCWANGVVAAAWRGVCGWPSTLAINMQTGEVWDALDCLMEPPAQPEAAGSHSSDSSKGVDNG